MTKHYCDRCGTECKEKELSTIKIPTVKTRNGFEFRPADVCPACAKEYDNIIDTLTDIRFLMFDKFFKQKGE